MSTERWSDPESVRLGVRIVEGVSAKTSMLVTAGAMEGTKAAKARELGTRVVHPDTYTHLLGHLQPALARDVRALPKAAARFATVRHWRRSSAHNVSRNPSLPRMALTQP